MKHSMMRVLSLFLVLVLTAGLLPTAVFAGPSVETIDAAEVFVSYPIGNQKPNSQGQITAGAGFTIEFVHFFDCYDGQPVGAYLQNTNFVAGRLYACQVCLKPMSGYQFTESTVFELNKRSCETYLQADGALCGSVFFTAAAGTVPVTFDANGSKAAPPAPIQVPIGGTVWDAIPTFDAVRMPDQDYEAFWDWGLEPFSNKSEPFFFSSTVTDPLTLYAIWLKCVDTVDLCVEVPGNCLTEDVYGPSVAIPANADYSVSTDNFFSGLVEGRLHYDLVYVGPFEKGMTYYSHVYVYGQLGAKLPKLNLHGAQHISTYRLNDWELEIIFSVTAPSGDSLTKASAYLETPRAGQSAEEHQPELVNLTPGLEMSVNGWYETDTPSGTPYTGTLQGGKTYYALINIGGYWSKYHISADTLKLELLGKNVKLLRLEPHISGYANHLQAMVAVTIPKTYQFVVEVSAGGGGMFRSDRHGENWVSIMDFGGVEEGPVTLEAKAAHGYAFKMWYDADTFELLSKDASYTFELKKDVHIIASFAPKPFEDVGVWDFFYEPVLWALDKGITNGTDATHFSPKKECTRADVVTFLWRTMGSPEPSSSSNPFTDVNAGTYYYKAVLWAVENGITTGASATVFNPKGICTREQVVTFLYRAVGEPSPGTSTCPFVDVSSSSFSYNAILWAVSQNPPITTGTNATHFSPKNSCTRGQVVTFLYRAFGPKG